MLSANSAVWAQGVINVVEDFEGELPGAQEYPGGYSFAGGGLPPDYADILPPITTKEVVAAGFDSAQAYQITIDSSANAGGYFYFGMGGFHGFFGENFGFAQGQPGEDNPANFAMTFDLKSAGHVNPVPVRGQVTLYKSDYEVVFGVDLNSDGDMEDGFDIWTSGFGVAPAADDYADFNHVTWNLAEGSAPTVPSGSPVPAPLFEDEASFAFQIFFNDQEFGNDAGNVITIDNVALTFTPPVIVDGDYNVDGQVDGSDLLVWQRGESPGGLTSGDLQTWRNNYGQPLSLGAISAVPEPAGMGLAAGALSALALAARRRASAGRASISSLAVAHVAAAKLGPNDPQNGS
jgi:hypothetical protein